MRDVVAGFYLDVLRHQIAAKKVSINDSVLVVCGGPLDVAVMQEIGFKNAVVTNVDSGMAALDQDAENLGYADNSFDLVVVHAGLHHCQSPHRALLEMYRVARKQAIAFEARDSLLMRTAVRLGFTVDFELEAVSGDFKTGGVDNGPIPNYIYRWKEREIEKTIASYDPGHVAEFSYFYDMRIPVERFTRTKKPLLRLAGRMIEPASKLFAKLFPSQCNEFAFAINKSRQLQPWMETETLMSRDYAVRHGRMYV